MHGLNQASDLAKLNPRKAPPSQAELDMKASGQSFFFRHFPPDMWTEVFAFAPDPNDVVSMALTCGLMHSICQINNIWWPSLRYTFPRVHAQIDTNVAEPPNWKSLVVENALKLKAFQRVITTMMEKKEAGNKLFIENRYSQAKSEYNAALYFSNDPLHNPLRYDLVLSKDVKIQHLHLVVTLHSNMIITEMKLDAYPASLLHGLKAQRHLKLIKKLLDNDSEYKNRFGLLEEKVQVIAVKQKLRIYYPVPSQTRCSIFSFS